MSIYRPIDTRIPVLIGGIPFETMKAANAYLGTCTSYLHNRLKRHSALPDGRLIERITRKEYLALIGENKMVTSKNDLFKLTNSRLMTPPLTKYLFK
jgi:hypothetical protein